ncbi:Isoflavone reductase-like protein [Rhynchospora pubera]|uniref:Isoflavone reductase-like protein n=1 Tax=Rhynchospora pubera TaxID=906938 RepID=A0AAV8F7F7_9POAL|nr:Isoflavone reductase-like protein [Rhynchospora pubera]
MLLEAVKKVDVIISTLGSDPVQLELQTKIIKAIMEAGNIKRFIPSEFGMDPERVSPVEPAKTVFMMKAQIRQMIRNYNIPHTFIRSHIFQNFYIPRLGQAEISPPIYDTVGIIGDGDAQGSPPSLSFQLSIAYSVYINGVQSNFNIGPSSAVEATELYPEVDYITVDEFMDSLLSPIKDNLE